MHARHDTCRFSSRLFCLLLVYSLILSTVAPFKVSRAAAEAESPKVSIPPKATKAQQKGGRRDSEVLVRFRSGVSLQQKQDAVSSMGAKSARRLRGASQIYVIHLPAGQVPEAAAAQLLLNPAVQEAEPNYLIVGDEAMKNLPSAEKPSLRDNAELKREPSSAAGATQAGQTTSSEPGAIIAVIDSGVDFAHPDLRPHQWRNPKESDNQRDDDRNGFVDDLYGFDWLGKGEAGSEDSGHGTMVAGLIASQKNSAAAASMQQPLALMSLRVLDSNGRGDVASAIEAIDYATMMGASIINCSWGMEENSAFLRQAIERAATRNVLVVASAGNDSRDIEAAPYYPASYGLSNLLVVASTNSSSDLASWSNRGAAHVHVAAPGDNITSTGRNGGYETLLGTSASAAIASGIAGLIKTERPSLSAERTRELILAGARAVPALKDKVSSGGVIDAAGTIAKTEALPPNKGRDNRDDSPGNGQGGNNAPGNSAGGNGGNGSPVTPPEQVNRTKGTPGLNLPNLDLIRNRKPQEPKAVPSIPSTMRAIKDSVSERRDVGQAPTQLLAWSSEVTNVDSLISNARGGVSDSPFSLFGGMSSPAPPPPASYSAVADFSSSQNPNSYWSYGYKTLSGSTFTSFSSNINLFGAGLDSWSQGSCCPFVTRNNTGTTYTYPSATWVTQPADVLNLHPGSNGDKAVVRWTAPSSGTYTIEGRYQGIDSTGPTTSEVAIFHNSTSVFTGAVNGYGNQATFSVTRTVAAGDTIDFQVGYGSNNNYSYDSTGLAATISPTSRYNVALASNGAVATSSSNYGALFTASNAINGEHKGLNYFGGGVWHSSAQTFPQWMQIDFNGSKTIDEIDVYAVQDNYTNPIEPTETTTFSLYGLTNYEAQYWNGTSWATIPGGSVSGNK
jgi:thermitase